MSLIIKYKIIRLQDSHQYSTGYRICIVFVSPRRTKKTCIGIKALIFYTLFLHYFISSYKGSISLYCLSCLWVTLCPAPSAALSSTNSRHSGSLFNVARYLTSKTNHGRFIAKFYMRVIKSRFNGGNFFV